MKATIFDGQTVRPYTDSDSAALKQDTPYVWIDAFTTEARDPEVLQMLKQMGLTEIVAAYTTRKYSSGMFQAFGDNMLGSTYAAADAEQTDPPVLIHCVWNAGCFITIRSGADKAIATALRDIKPRAKALFESPAPVPGVLMQLIVDSIDRQLTDLQTQIGILDGQIIITTNPEQITQLQQLRTPLEDLGTTIPTYAENISESLVDAGSLPGANTEAVQALKTYQACINDIVQRIDSASADIRSAIQDYQGQVSTAQGNRINQLTLVSIIFLPVTFLTGYFGMNFQYLVNATESFASWLVLGIIGPIACVVVSVALLRKGGFKVGHPVRFRTRGAHKKKPKGTAAPEGAAAS